MAALARDPHGWSRRYKIGIVRRERGKEMATEFERIGANRRIEHGKMDGKQE